ncbi:MAG TPA: PAS domain S-box protein [Thermoanaerobaculia bacterium]|nr:PAS domain S-box protein [Thermoanaerobaculia bacterium]
MSEIRQIRPRRGPRLSEAEGKVRPTVRGRLLRRILRLREAERALRTTAAILRAHEEATEDGVLVLDTEGRLLTFNQKFLEMWKVPPEIAEANDGEELEEWAFRLVADPDSLRRDIDWFRSNPLEVRSGEIIEMADGRTLTRLAIPVLGREGTPIGRALYFREITALRRSERLQNAMFHIADLTLACEDLDGLYRSIHGVVGELTDATNFYIALYDEKSDTLSFPYFLDQYDEKPERRRPGKTLTGYVLRTGEPLLATPETFARLVREGEVEQIGAASVDWIGVPLKSGDRTFGVLGIQSYDERTRFDEQTRDILTFVSQHVASAIEAKRREDAIRESERRYRQLFENNRAIKFVIDPESGSILDVNQGACEFYGYSREEFVGMKVWDINVLGEEGVRKAMADAALQKKASFVFRHQLKSGEMRDVEVHSGPVDLHGKKVLYSIVNDVTERIRAEEALRRSEEYFRTVIENASDIISIIEPDGRVVYNSPSIYRVLGYKAPHSIDKNFYAFVHPADVELVRSHLETIAQGAAELDPVEIRLRHRDGSWRIIEAMGRRIVDSSARARVVTNCRDMTERKLAEQALQSSEEKYRNIFDFASIGIYQSSPEGTLITANQTLARILGYGSIGELLQKNLSTEVYFDPIDRELLIDRHAEQGRSAELEILWKRKDGSPVWVQLNAHAVKNERGRVLYYEGFVTDIDTRKRAEATLRTQAIAMEASMDGIAIVDRNLRLTYVNHAFLKLFRYRTAGDLIGSPWSTLYDQDEGERFAADIFPAVSVSGEWRGEAVGRRRNGLQFPQEISLTAIENGGMIAIVRDITERTHAEEQIKFLAYHDALTSLPNRLLFKDRVVVGISHAQRERGRLAILFLDLDHFKFINDSLGHNVGDRLLQEVAKRIQSTLRESDTVARLGGDEFTILLPSIVEPDDARRVGDKLLEAVRAPLQLEGHEFAVTTSVGVSVYPEDGVDAETLIKNADTAMYQAKEEGRDTCRMFNAAASARAIERLALEQGLRKALANGEFVMFYQPILELRTGRICGMEALLRWEHPELGIIPPGEFITVAEQTGLMVPIGSWALQTACRQARTWERLGYTSLTLSVNLSVSQLQHELIERVRLALDDSALLPERLELEITESGAMQHPERSIQLLEDVRKLGVRISLDDFGTGHSSLSYLKRFPIDTLKIDQSFVRDLGSDRDTAAIVAAIIAIGHKLRLRVIAEGVELEAQRVFLMENSCDQMQGYLFHGPLPAERFEQLLGEHNSRVRQWPAVAGTPG